MPFVSAAARRSSCAAWARARRRRYPRVRRGPSRSAPRTARRVSPTSSARSPAAIFACRASSAALPDAARIADAEVRTLRRPGAALLQREFARRSREGRADGGGRMTRAAYRRLAEGASRYCSRTPTELRLTSSAARLRAATVLLGATLACRPATGVSPASISFGRDPGLRRYIDSLTDAPEFSNAHWGILIVDPRRGDTLYSRNAGKLFMPASNMKILTSATALRSSARTIATARRFSARGPIADGTLNGDLRRHRARRSVGQRSHDARRDDARCAPSPTRSRREASATSPAASSPAATRFPATCSASAGRTTTSRTPTPRRSTSCCSTKGSASCTCAAAIAPGAPVRVERRPARSYPRVRIMAVTVAPSPTRQRARAGAPTRCARSRTARRGTSSSRAQIAVRDSATIEVTHHDPRRRVRRGGWRGARREGHHDRRGLRRTRRRASTRSRR